MPVSLAVESDRQPHDPPPGTDVTSDIRVKNTRPCETACQRLSRCAMDLPECQSADTRSQHDFVENCYQECRKSQKVKGILLGETDCQRALDEAQTSLDGFQQVWSTLILSSQSPQRMASTSEGCYLFCGRDMRPSAAISRLARSASRNCHLHFMAAAFVPFRAFEVKIEGRGRESD